MLSGNANGRHQHKQTPPPNARRIWRVADLPIDRASAKYELTNGEDKPTVVSLCKRKRQVVDLLNEGPVYCASPVRISDVVHILKREVGLEVEAQFFTGDPATGVGDFGIYFLETLITCLADQPSEVAA